MPRANGTEPDITVWVPRLYQSQMGGKPFEQWAPCYYSRGWADGAPHLTMNMDDIGVEYTLESARAECARRNTLRLHNARKAVEAADAQLTDAREKLARLEAAFATQQ